jgi:thiol-disulfide isomerase/thioredoxin
MANAKWRIVLAAIAATTLLVAAVLAYEIARRASAPAPQVAGSSAPTGSANPNSSANSLALSVFEQPRPLPEIWFQDDQGHDLTLAEFRGRVVLLNIWATWCVPCRQEMPTLDRLGGKDFLVMALSIDRKGVDAVRDFYREIGVEKLAIYLDPSGRGSRGLAIPGVPTTLLIDQEGREVARKMGAAEWDGPEMVSLIERTIRGESASPPIKHLGSDKPR